MLRAIFSHRFFFFFFAGDPQSIFKALTEAISSSDPQRDFGVRWERPGQWVEGELPEDERVALGRPGRGWTPAGGGGGRPRRPTLLFPPIAQLQGQGSGLWQPSSCDNIASKCGRWFNLLHFPLLSLNFYTHGFPHRPLPWSHLVEVSWAVEGFGQWVGQEAGPG